MKKKILLFSLLIILNIILCPKVFAYENGREVFVRHLDMSGNIINGLANVSQEAIDNAGNSSLIANSTADDATIVYSEYYEYPVSSTMEITKTLVIENNLVHYAYSGYNVCTMPSLDEAYAIMEQKRSGIKSGTAELDVTSGNLNSNAVFKTMQSNNNDVTIIDFYYRPSSSNNVSPKLYSNTSVWNGNDAGLTSNVTYVPSGEYIYPYFETPSYFVKDLAYEKVISNGKVRYKVNRYSVYRLNRAELISSESKHIGLNGQIEITGTLVSNTDPAAAFGGVGDVSPVPVVTQDGVKSVLMNMVNNYNASDSTFLPGRGDLDDIDGYPTGKADFDANIITKNDALNGLRSAKGKVYYTEYNVIANADVGGELSYTSTNDHYINIFTPVKLNQPQVTVTGNASIDHSVINSSTVILADDATFEIQLSQGDLDFTYYNNITAEQKAKFVTYYYLIFDFDIIHNGQVYEKGKVVRLTNQGRYNNGITYFYGQVAPNETLSRDNSNHKIIILAAAKNMPSTELLYEVAGQELEIQVDKTLDPSQRKYLTDSGDNTANFSNDIEFSENHTDPEFTKGAKMYGDGYYFAMYSVAVKTASKIFDFQITDCSDAAFKSVFRKNDSMELANNSYYSGIRRMLITSIGNKESTALLDRNNIHINGTSSNRTLPLGPYKHTTASYVNAPKLGYRIAYSVKTSGYYSPSPSGINSRKINIKPSYYYLSKDGTNIIKDIDLYYKDDSGKYKKFIGSNYNIFFIPNDGSRYTTDTFASNVSNMSTKQESLNIGSSSGEFSLTDSMMALDDDGYIQTWYGEFKLPNTTIAVRAGDNVDNALKDGYIGVKFDISCFDASLSETISYNVLNKSVNNAPNTTQWDYEGYLGFSNPTQPINQDSSLRLQLENGIWVIDNQDTYNFVRGTVLLYDIDARAADDIQ